MSKSQRLDEACDITMGQAPSGESYNQDGDGLPLIAGAGDFGELHPVAKKFTNAPGKVCAPGDIVLGIRATIGEKVVADRDYCLGRGVAGLRARDGLSSRFLWHWLSHSAPVLASRAKGATFKQVNREDIGGLLIARPPVPEQRRIAEILDKAHALRVKRREALAQLDTLPQSTFIDMFGDPVSNPMEWPVAPLGGAFELKHGFAFKSEQFVPEGEFVLLTPGNFFEKGGFRGRGAKQRYHNEPVPQEYVLDQGDLLIAMTEQAPGLLGSPILVPESRKFLHNQRLGKVVKKVEINSLFIFELMNASSIRARIQQDSTGTKVKHTSPKKIAAIKVGVPPIDLQRRFAAIVDSVELQKAKQRSHLAELDSFFASLQHRAFRGEL